MTTHATTAQLCATCDTNGRKGYCAPARCYCAHEACHAFASWHPLPDLREVAPAPRKPARASSWDTREESTWIDQI